MAATWRLSVGWVRPSLRAAADSEPVSAVSRNAFSWFQSRLIHAKTYMFAAIYRSSLRCCAWIASGHHLILHRSHAALAVAPTDAMPRPSRGPAQARFWDRIARKYAADPIADMAGYEPRCGACKPAVARAGRAGDRLRHRHHGLAPGAFTRRLLATDVSAANDRHRPRKAGRPPGAAAELRGGRRRRAGVWRGHTTRCWPSTCCTW
jgi:hypothetical protein